MKVFISWSGEKSKHVALLLKEWIGSVIQVVKPWVSDKDIERGAQWFSEISNVLSDCNIGIVCLTEENKNNPWILFESGALAKGVPANRLCTFLIDLKPTDIQPPLSQFNHTESSKEGLYKLMHTINNSLGENKLAAGILEKSFEVFYPTFQESFENILKTSPPIKAAPTKNQSELLEQVLLSVRNMEKEMYVKDMKMIDLLKEFLQNQSGMSIHTYNQIKKHFEALESKDQPLPKPKPTLGKIREYFDKSTEQ